MSDNTLENKNGVTKPCRINKATKSFEVDYDPNLRRVILKILDTEGFYPFWVYDPEAGFYEIKKTQNRRLQMTK